MLKKIILLFTAMAASNGALADVNYLGASMGLSLVQITKDLTYPVNDPPLTSHQFGSYSNGFHGQVFVGRQFDFQLARFSVQGDFDGMTNVAKDRLNNYFIDTPASVTERLNYNFGVFVLPDLALNDKVHLFAGPGYVIGHFVVNSGYTGGTLGVTGDHQSWLNGWGVKVGMQSTLSNHWDVLLAYQYNQYQNVYRSGIEPLTDGMLQASYKPSLSMISLGARYLFGHQV